MILRVLKSDALLPKRRLWRVIRVIAQSLWLVLEVGLVLIGLAVLWPPQHTPRMHVEWSGSGSHRFLSWGAVGWEAHRSVCLTGRVCIVHHPNLVGDDRWQMMRYVTGIDFIRGTSKGGPAYRKTQQHLINFETSTLYLNLEFETAFGGDVWHRWTESGYRWMFMIHGIYLISCGGLLLILSLWRRRKRPVTSGAFPVIWKGVAAK